MCIINVGYLSLYYMPFQLSTSVQHNILIITATMLNNNTYLEHWCTCEDNLSLSRALPLYIYIVCQIDTSNVRFQTESKSEHIKDLSRGPVYFQDHRKTNIHV